MRDAGDNFLLAPDVTGDKASLNTQDVKNASASETPTEKNFTGSHEIPSIGEAATGRGSKMSRASIRRSVQLVIQSAALAIEITGV